MRRLLAFAAILSTLLVFTGCQELTPAPSQTAAAEAGPTSEATPAVGVSATEEVTNSEGVTQTGPVSPTGILSNTGTMTQTSTGNIVDVQLVTFDIHMLDTLPAGPTEFRITNAGDTQHSFEIEGQDIQKKLDSPLQPGESATLQVDLKPGQYNVYCPVDGHRGMGMLLALTVTAP